jgi:hypothetical protein
MNPLILSKIVSIAQKAINGKMTWMQVLVLDEKMYSSKESLWYWTKVTNSDLYDVALISKNDIDTS